MSGKIGTNHSARERQVQKKKAKAIKYRENGNSVTASYLSAGISKTTFYRWRRLDSEFDQAFINAGGLAQIELLGKLKRLAEDKGDWRGIAWILERGWPDDWSLRREVERMTNSGEGKGASLVLEMIAQTDQRLSELNDQNGL